VETTEMRTFKEIGRKTRLDRIRSNGQETGGLMRKRNEWKEPVSRMA
jgi:hypothetical protein